MNFNLGSILSDGVTGLEIGGPIGGLVGAGVGLLSGLLGGNSASSNSASGSSASGGLGDLSQLFNFGGQSDDVLTQLIQGLA